MISLIHPSRGRPQKSFDNTNRWLDHSSTEIQVIVSCDYSDKYLDDYLKIYKPLDEKMGDLFEVMVSANENVVQATNRALHAAVGDILIYLSDDFDCPNKWDELVIAEFAKYQGPVLVKVDDCLQKFNVPVLTIPMMNRAFCNAIGYFWHPEYFSMHVDEDLYWTAVKLLALRPAPHLKFPHKHHSLGKCANDETYRRSEGNWNHGKTTFARRKAAGFPL